MHRACHTASAAWSGGQVRSPYKAYPWLWREREETGKLRMARQAVTEANSLGNAACLPTPYHQVTIRPYIANFVITDGATAMDGKHGRWTWRVSIVS